MTAKNGKSNRVPRQMQSKFEEIASLSDEFCQEYLNDEYAEIVRKATAALCRKRPSPLTRGRISVWACSIVNAVGYVNFLSDRSNPPYISSSDLCKAFGVGQSTASNKAKEIRLALKMRPFDPEWSLKSLTDRNPLVWTLIINGTMVDTRDLPEEIQEALVDEGYLPYMPPSRSSNLNED